MTFALLPWPDLDTSGIEYATYDGLAQPSAQVLDRVTFYVRPYLGAEPTLDLMARMPALQVVQSLNAGVDDVWPALPAGVSLHNAAGVHDASTAELAVGLTLASLRGIDGFVRAQGQGHWEEHLRWQDTMRTSLADRRVMIVGYGRIGAAIEARLTPFEVEVVRVASRPRTDEHGRPVHGLGDLPVLLPHVDVVILVVPLNDQTRGMVDKRFLAWMKDGSLLVNVGRGPLVVTADLLAELERGRLHAALDVTDPEPLPPGHPLWRAPGVLISPHVGGNSSAFEPRARRLVQDQLRRYAAGEPLVNTMVRPRAETLS